MTRKTHGTRLAGAALVCAAGVWSAAGLAQEPVTFVDVAGNRVEIAQPAERIVSIVNPIAGSLMSIAAGPERMVGMNPSIRGPMINGILGEIFPGLAEIPHDIVVGGTGFAPNVETIAALEPDMVIQWGDREDDLVAPLRNAGLPLALHLYVLGSHELAENDMIAGMIGQPGRAEVFNTWRRDVWGEIEAVVASIPETARISALQVSLLSEGIITAYGTGTPSDVHIRHIGAINPARNLNGFANINAEQLASWDPDVILVMADHDAAVGDLYDHPLLSAMTAARTRQIYLLPIGTARWGTSTQDDPLFWMWMANLFYPDHFNYDIRAELRAAFLTMYRHALTEDQLDRVLRVAGNADTAAAGSFTL